MQKCFNCDDGGGGGSQELSKLRREVSSLGGQLDRARDAISRMKEDSSSSSCVIAARYDVRNGDRRPADLVRQYGELYSTARLDTLDALDGIPELADANELKNKLLFSVVVVSSC